MDHIRELKSCFIIFYLFGHTSFIPLKSGKLKALLLISFIPKIAYFLILIMEFYTTLQLFYVGTKIIFNNILIATLFLLNWMSGIFILYSSVSSPHALLYILKMFANTILYTEHKLSKTICMNRLLKDIHKKTLYAFMTVFGFFLFGLTTIAPANNFLLLIVLMAKVMIVMQMVLLINLIEIILSTLNEKLVDLTRKRKYRFSVSCLFQQIKLIHYNLWTISQNINQHFGWILIFILIGDTAIIGFTIYKLIILLNETDLFCSTDPLNILRKYHLPIVNITNLSVFV